MEVLIAGAGICGLSAAIGLRRQGHRVTLFEQSQLAVESGAAIFLPPNANGPLRAWGFKPEDYGANQYQGTKHFASNGNLDFIEAFNGDEFWSQWDLIRRSSLHAGLKDLAVGSQGDGTPAKLLTSSRVASIDADKPSLRLENGTEFTGDIILGADGSHSISRTAINIKNQNNEPIEPFNTGKNCFRFLIEREKLLSDPLTRKPYEENGHLVAWFGEKCHLVTYPCEYDKLINFVAIHPKKSNEADSNDYNSQGSYEDLRSAFADFEPTVQKILDLVEPEDLKLYPLNDMDHLPTYTKGKFALLGDAAHPFLPYLGQGGAQAIEDAVSVATLLPAGTKAEEVPRRLRLYEQARKERVEEVLRLTRLVGGGMSPDSELDFPGIRMYNYDHDESKHSRALLEQELRGSA